MEFKRGDSKQVAATGYDRVAKPYNEWVSGVRVEERAKYTEVLLQSPCEEHPKLIQDIATWLKPGGFFCCFFRGQRHRSILFRRLVRQTHVLEPF